MHLALMSLLAFGLLVLDFSGCVSVGAGTAADASRLDFVVIDQKQRAYTVFMGIPPGMPDEKLKEVKAWVAKEQLDTVDWKTFRGDIEKYVRKRIVKNEYEGSLAVEGIVELLKKFSGNPIGLTWNGGVAITYNDYRHAERTYQRYVDNPAEYERTRVRDPRLDPVNPVGHLTPLLGW